MATKLHLLTFAEQYRRRQQRRTSLRLVFVAAFVGLCAFAAGRASAVELHLVVHGASWHDGTRTETYTTTEQRVVRLDDKRHGSKDSVTQTVSVTRERAVDWNQANLGLGLRAGLSPAWGVQAGYYRNSYDRDTVYAVGEYTPLAWGAMRAGAFAGLATGYQERDVSAGAGLLLRLQGPRASLAVRVMPKVVSAQSGTTVAVEAGWRL